MIQNLVWELEQKIWVIFPWKNLSFQTRKEWTYTRLPQPGFEPSFSLAGGAKRPTAPQQQLIEEGSCYETYSKINHMITCIKITLSYERKREKEGRRVNALFGDIDLLRSFQRFALLLDSANQLGPWADKDSVSTNMQNLESQGIWNRSLKARNLPKKLVKLPQNPKSRGIPSLLKSGNL